MGLSSVVCMPAIVPKADLKSCFCTWTCNDDMSFPATEVQMRLNDVSLRTMKGWLDDSTLTCYGRIWVQKKKRKASILTRRPFSVLLAQRPQ
jgi:hypothetical protein